MKRAKSASLTWTAGYLSRASARAWRSAQATRSRSSGSAMLCSLAAANSSARSVLCELIAGGGLGKCYHRRAPVSDPEELEFYREASEFSGKAREGSLPGQVTDQATQSVGVANAPEGSTPAVIFQFTGQITDWAT